jgi:hypothetical protein
MFQIIPLRLVASVALRELSVFLDEKGTQEIEPKTAFLSGGRKNMFGTKTVKRSYS